MTRPLSRRAVWMLASLAVAAVAAAIVAVAEIRRPPAGEASLEQLGDYGSVPAFSLTERSGRTVGLDDLRGLVWIVDFIYTECTETCPTQSLQLAGVQRDFATAGDLRLVSITVDPQHDTPEVLQRYAKRYEADARWWFLTGDKRAIYCLAAQGFRLSVVDPSDATPPACGQTSRASALLNLLPLAATPAWASHGSKGLVMHSARLVLVDRQARIRAYHLATDLASMTRLRTNVQSVLRERAN